MWHSELGLLPMPSAMSSTLREGGNTFSSPLVWQYFFTTQAIVKFIVIFFFTVSQKSFRVEHALTPCIHRVRLAPAAGLRPPAAQP
eukprot:CAMPEP_0194687998 /NCGR_PEP_ID=MMETSP0295-20121207/16633_1 /TAXON_ID=39354 /ORGANISM="Heterosigma akashiwo, Strain CCMP2393" /LENGTH=85 /DNA_ID=CAMNT_0039576523 /DNA_START=482 /DNA_END=735 /DNA_ORIENTATION=-